jgi:tetratricopeptide (TPR) repeat protein
MSTSNHNFSGKIDLAFCTSEETLEIAKESGDIFIKGMAYASHGVSCYFKGLLNEAEDNLLKGLAYSEKNAQVGWVSVASLWLGERYVEMGEFEKACHYYKVGISTLEGARILPFFVRLAKVCVARAESSLQEKNTNLNELFDFYNTTKPKIFEGWMARNIGEILLNFDDDHMPAAEDWIKKAIEANKRNGTIWFLANDYALFARLLQRKGDLTKAKESLNKAIEIFKECAADGWVEKAGKELAAI